MMLGGGGRRLRESDDWYDQDILSSPGVFHNFQAFLNVQSCRMTRMWCGTELASVKGIHSGGNVLIRVDERHRLSARFFYSVKR
ncbi:hypothetical protein [Paenibacillus mendelii]|uniref:Uncharacterized protein n=1 Tax=Paenibacillus mendelii TaxID=206163 RepID=A0ABV6JCV9_9BACL|nr:hypothetical protein [Paenibacillus mendelii]MCQ6561621.1 hypothetical protein [Paenibacillus mendelii]